MPSAPINVAWISDYPIEWMADLPEELRGLPKQHPATWMMVLLGELEKVDSLRLHVIALRKNTARDVLFERNGVTFHVLKVRGGLRAPSLFWIDTMLIGRRLRQIQPRLVHAWGTERGAALIASRLPYPYLVTMQGLLSWYKDAVGLSGYERFAAALENVSLRRARIVTTESKFAVGYLQRRYPNLIVCQAEHAPNPVFRQVQRRPQINPIRFISVGTLSYRKGSDLLLRALNRLVDEFPFELLLISGPDARLFESLKAELLPEFLRRVSLKSHLPPAEVANELAAATMKVLPTRADTSPNAVKEAVIAGVPVVASAVGGIPDYVVPGKSGLLFPAGDLDGLVNALRAACRHPLFSQGKVEPESLEQSRSYLSSEKMARRFEEIYARAQEFSRERAQRGNEKS